MMFSKELSETLVKNKDLGASLQGRSMGICIFNHHPRSILFTLKKDSKYKSHLVSGVLPGLGRRLYIKKKQETNEKMMKKGTQLP